VRGGSALSLVVLDVDHFKLYNDSLGHPAGDSCLQQVAQAIASHASRPGDLAARYGGEEFVLLFADTGADSALPWPNRSARTSKRCSCRIRAPPPRRGSP
jgi:diguanylate cyclase (GGDEF)-like protein